MSTQPSSIIVCVTGSIAAYRACDLVRSLSKQNFDVRVLMTEAAEHFVGKLSFQALSNNPVYSSEWDAGMVHIDIKNHARLIAVVPATANTIGKFASGIADDIISSTYLAATCPVLVAPAMNPGMYAHPAMRRNLQQLQDDGVHIVEPGSGKVVCGDEGQGKLAEIRIIENRILELIK